MSARIDRIDYAADCLAKLPLEDLEILQRAIMRLQEYHATLWEAADHDGSSEFVELAHAADKSEYVGARMMHHAILTAMQEVERAAQSEGVAVETDVSELRQD